MQQTSSHPEPGLRKVAGGLRFPEGPAYDGKGSVIVSNCSGPYLTRVPVQKGRPPSLYLRPRSPGRAKFTFQKPNGATFFQDGSLFVCDFGLRAIVRIYPGGAEQIAYARAYNNKPFRGPNDLAFDPAGNLYVTDPAGSNRANPIGCVYRIARGTRAVARVADGLAFPNGIAFAADAKSLYVCESQRSRVLRFRVAPDGSLADPQVAADLGWGDPDGMAVDASGNLVVAHFGGGAVRIFQAGTGKLVRVIPVPGKQVTNVEFAGRDLRTLFITEAETGSVYALSMPTPGLPLFCAPRNTG